MLFTCYKRVPHLSPSEPTNVRVFAYPKPVFQTCPEQKKSGVHVLVLASLCPVLFYLFRRTITRLSKIKEQLAWDLYRAVAMAFAERLDPSRDGLNTYVPSAGPSCASIKVRRKDKSIGNAQSDRKNKRLLIRGPRNRSFAADITNSPLLPTDDEIGLDGLTKSVQNL